MTYTLKLHSDDSGTEIDLSTGSSGYRPIAAADNETSVSEAFTFRIIGGTALTTPRNTIRDISNFFNQAARLQTERIYPRIWVYFKWDGSDVEYRSPLYGGQIIPSPRALTKGLLSASTTEWDITWSRGNYWEDTTERTATPSTDSTDNHYRTWASDGYIYNCQQNTAVSLEVLAAGDGATKTFAGTTAHYPIWYQLYRDEYTATAFTITLRYVIGGVTTNVAYPATNADLTTFTLNRRTGAYSLVFANAPDNATNIRLSYYYGYGNTVEFEADKFVDASGDNDLPTPLKLDIVNQSGTYNLKYIYLAICSAQQSTWPRGLHRMDDVGATGGTQVADVGCTLGFRRDFTVTTANQALWTTTTIDMDEDAHYYIPIVRFSPTANTANIDDLLIQWKVLDGTLSGVVYYEGEQYRPAPDSLLIQPTGYIMFPPWPNPDRRNPGNFKLQLWMQSTTGGSITASIDYVQLMPADSFTRVSFVGSYLAQSESLIIDGGLKQCYIDNNAGTPTFLSNTEVLYGWPEIKPGYADGGFMYAMFHDDTNFVAPIDWPLSMTVYYRPRRRLL